MASAVERIASRLIRLEKRVNGLATGPQMGYSSLEDGSLEEYDQDGQLVSIIGKQPDGTHGAVVVSGPVPPRPSAAVVTTGPGLLNYGWDGNFADEATGETDITVPAPMDFARVEAHASKLQGFTADSAATLLDTFESPRGGSRTAMLEPGTWFVVLVVRASSGKRSAQSVEAPIQVEPPVGWDIDIEALKEEFRAVDDEMNAAILQNQRAQATLTGTVNTLKNTTLPALDRDLALANERLVSAQTAIDDVIPANINAARQAAIDAAKKDASADAKAKADKALADAKADAAAQIQVVVNTLMGQSYYGTAVPNATAPAGPIREGSTYRRKNSSGHIIGEYEYVSGAWVQRKMTSESFTAVDVGVLTAGSAAILDVVAQKMAAATAAFQTVDIGNLFVTGTSALNTVTAKKIAADVGEFLKVSTDQLVAGTASFGTAVADKFFAEVVAGRKFYANQIIVGQPGNLMPDPGFNDAGMTSLRNQHSTCTVSISSSNDLTLTNSSAGAQYLRPLGTAQSQAGVLANGWIAVKPGEVWSFTLQPSAFKGAGLMKFVGRTLDGSAYANPAASKTIPVSSTTTEELTVEATIPANCYWIIPEVTVPTGGASYIKRNTMAVAQKVTPALIVDGLMNGQRIVGASIETNAASQRGVKITDAGLFAYDSTGKETVRLDGANSILTGATIRTAATGARIQMSEAGLEGWGADNTQYLRADADGLSILGTLVTEGINTDEWATGNKKVRTQILMARRKLSDKALESTPGIWFEAGYIDGTKPPLALPAGITSYQSGTTGRPGDSLSVKSGKVGDGYAGSGISVGPGSASMRSSGPTNNGWTESSEFSLAGFGGIILSARRMIGSAVRETFRLESVVSYPESPAELYSYSGLDISGGPVTINGRPQSYVPSTLASVTNGFTHLTSSGWSGVRYSVSGDVVEVTGAFTRAAAYAPGTIIGSIPAAYRPSAKKKGLNADITTAGEIEITISGSGANSFSVTYIR